MILICRCLNRRLVPRPAVAQLVRTLVAAGRPHRVVADLCGLVARHPERLRRQASAGTLTVVACFPRAVRWLLHVAGVETPEQAQLLNLRTDALHAVARSLGVSLAADSHAPQLEPASPAGETADPWFPVIDYDRCRQCRQCHAFCLFGVYSLTEAGRVVVSSPDACKNNCPACARICPHTAIMFPKLDEAPLRGDEVHAGTLAGARVGLDPAALAGGDLYTRLRRRRLLRRTTEQKAHEERAVRLQADRPPSPPQEPEGMPGP